MCKYKAALGIAFVLVILVAASARAHPHVFGDTYLTICFDKSGLAAIKVRWRFDQMFTALIADEFDRNHDGSFSADEVKVIEKEAFANLANYGYFTHIWIDKRKFRIKWVKDFKASLQQGHLMYAFTIPCHVAASSSYKRLTISPYDPTFYTDLVFARKDAFLLEGNSAFQVESSMGRSREISIYYGQVHPLELRLRFRRQP